MLGFVSYKTSKAELFCWINEYEHGKDVLIASFHVAILAFRFEKLL